MDTVYPIGRNVSTLLGEIYRAGYNATTPTGRPRGAWGCPEALFWGISMTISINPRNKRSAFESLAFTHRPDSLYSIQQHAHVDLRSLASDYTGFILPDARSYGHIAYARLFQGII